ncbi:uncharacterized protein N7483_003503 [Penicillium malachiteum]|uniref:uncharacterized protein n=1 Tax=Penicillium malachiteum TaxID=1324776 RepID=UPI002547EE54|nr:uncharacterized protein N7483_003503 [Penicillium malachiteum]KAJ5728995.1 hypothetical protein N7483_003503 [Penicillium malachiteum]
MRRKAPSTKKQARLAFAPAIPALDGSGNDGDRYRTLSYQHPSLATVRARSPRNGKTSKENSPQVKLPIRPKKGNQKSTQLSFQTLDGTFDVSDTSDLSSPISVSEPSPEDEIVVPSAQKKRARVQSPDIPDEETEENPRPRRKLKRKSESSPVLPIDSDDEPVLSSPIKRRRKIEHADSPKKPRVSAEQDELDIEEDVRDLQDSVIKTTRTRGRLAESARDKKLKTLEAIRRKRAGKKVKSEDDENGSDEDEEGSPTKHGRNRDDEEEDEDDEDDEDDEEEEDQSIPRDEDLDRYEDDFISDDDDTPLGVPADIPLKFTRHAYKKPKDYFQDVVAWMVHNRLDPAFPRSDDMYEMAFMKLEDEVKARVGSQFSSSVWNPGFRFALLARPQIEITAYSTDEDHSCDACNRSGHPASSDMKLYGKPYSLETLEPLNDSEEDQSRLSSDLDSNGSNETETECDYDRDGHRLPDENQRFLLGRNCSHKAQIAHTLTHWRFHLNEWVVDHLERMGHMKDEEVLRRNNLSQKRKTRNALKVLDGMIEAGEVEKLYRDFHTNLKTARGEKPSYHDRHDR